MKWFKHVSTASDDLFVKDLEKRFGHAGYAFWFKTLELIAAHGDGGSVTLLWSHYANILGTKRKCSENFLGMCRECSKISHETNGESVTITCMKFVEYADYYTKYNGLSAKRLQRRSRQVLRNVRGEEEVEEEVEEERDKDIVHPDKEVLRAPKKKEEKMKNGFDADQKFEEIWKRYPSRVGKSHALRHFKATVSNEEEYTLICRALENYLLSDRVKNAFVQNGSTWFNGWKDWIDFVEPTKRENETKDQKKARLLREMEEKTRS